MEENPYIVGSVIKKSDYFVGRSEIVEEITENLLYKSITMIHGQRRIGKSSILARLEVTLQNGNTGYLPVSVDLQGKLGNPLNQLAVLLSKAIKKKCRLNIPAIPLTDTAADNFKSKWLPEAIGEAQEKAKYGIVLLLDEFDDVSPRISASADQFYQFLGDILRGPIAFGLRVVVVLGRDPSKLKDSAQEMLVDARKIHISLMSKKEIYSLIDLSKNIFKWSEDAKEEVWDLAKGHPLISQSICSKIWYRKSTEISQGKKPAVEPHDVDGAFSYTEYGHVIENSWEILLPEEQVIVCFISSRSSRVHEDEILNFIEEMELTDSYNRRSLYDFLTKLKNDDWIEQDKNFYEIKVPIYQRWVTEHYELRELINKLFDNDKRAISLALQAQNATELPWAIRLLERSIKLSPDNNNIRAALVKNLELYINICIDELKNRLAIEYTDRLEQIDSSLAHRYKRKIEARVQTVILSQKIDSLLRDENFPEAIHQVNKLAQYDLQQRDTYSFRITTGQISFIVRRWFFHLLFWCPILLVAITIGQSSFPVEEFSLTLFDGLIVIFTLTMSLTSAILDSFRMQEESQYVSAAYFILGTFYALLGLYLIPNITLLVRILTIILLFFAAYLRFWPSDDVITRITGAFINLILLTLTCFWGSLLPDEGPRLTPQEITQAVDSIQPPNVPQLIWDWFVSIMEFSESRGK